MLTTDNRHKELDADTMVNIGEYRDSEEKKE